MQLIKWVKSLFSKEEIKQSPKFGIGDIVSVTICSDQSKLYKGVVININSANMYKVHFLCGTGFGATHWYLENELKKYSREEERDSLINQILNEGDNNEY